VSPRRTRRPREEPRPVPAHEHTEQWPDGEWIVRSIPGANSAKAYRCPGCDQEIPAGTPHVVAWLADDTLGVEDRRHWHTPCWQHRLRRRQR
jgi:hypothetical protein